MRQWMCGIVGVTMLAGTQAAFADGASRRGFRRSPSPGGRHFRHKADVDIESLEARLGRFEGRWRLRVRYDVEIEDAHPAARFDLVLRVTDDHRPLRGRSGRPVTFTVPLVRPTDWDRDEVAFEKTAVLLLPDGAIGNPRHLRLQAKVVRRTDGSALDREDTSISLERRQTQQRRTTIRRSRISSVRRTAGR